MSDQFASSSLNARWDAAEEEERARIGQESFLRVTPHPGIAANSDNVRPTDSLQDAGQLTELYEVDWGEKIGTGAFATVWGGHEKLTGKAVAVKRVNKSELSASGHRRLKKEVALLALASDSPPPSSEITRSRDVSSDSSGSTAITTSDAAESATPAPTSQLPGGKHDAAAAAATSPDAKSTAGAAAAGGVVRLLGFFEEAGAYFVVMERLSGGELFDHIHHHRGEEGGGGGGGGGYDEEEVRVIVRRLLRTVAALAQKGIAHRDIKPENILLRSASSATDCVLVDFGLAGRCSPSSKSCSLVDVVGTTKYMAPEVIRGGPYDTRCDVWGVGVVCFLLLSHGWLPFDGNSDKAIEAQVCRSERYLEFLDHRGWAHVSDGAVKFVKACLTPNFRKRPTAETLCATNDWLLTPTKAPTQPTAEVLTSSASPPLPADAASVTTATATATSSFKVDKDDDADICGATGKEVKNDDYAAAAGAVDSADLTVAAANLTTATTNQDHAFDDDDDANYANAGESSVLRRDFSASIVGRQEMRFTDNGTKGNTTLDVYALEVSSSASASASVSASAQHQTPTLSAARADQSSIDRNQRRRVLWVRYNSFRELHARLTAVTTAMALENNNAPRHTAMATPSSCLSPFSSFSPSPLPSSSSSSSSPQQPPPSQQKDDEDEAQSEDSGGGGFVNLFAFPPKLFVHTAATLQARQHALASWVSAVVKHVNAATVNDEPNDRPNSSNNNSSSSSSSSRQRKDEGAPHSWRGAVLGVWQRWLAEVEGLQPFLTPLFTSTAHE